MLKTFAVWCFALVSLASVSLAQDAAPQMADTPSQKIESPAPVVQSNPYEVPHVTIELTDVEPGAARDKAMKMAVTEGFSRLLRTLTAQDTWSRHEELISRTDPNKLLQRFTIVSEHTRPEYALTLDLVFNRDLVRGLLTKEGIPFSEVAAGPMLVLPLMDMPNGMLLWEENNPWRLALQQAAKKPGLVRFILPLGDAREMLMLTPEMAAFGAADMVAEVGRFYNAQVVVVPRFQLGFTNDGQQMIVDVSWYGPAMEPRSYTFPYNPAVPLEAALQDVAEKTLMHLEDDWRKQYMLDFDHPGQMTISLPQPTLKGLEKLRKNLAAVAIVKGVRIASAGHSNAILKVDFFGTPERVAEIAKEKGTTLTQNPNSGVWDVTAEVLTP